MLTTKLYEKDPYISEFESKTEQCVQEGVLYKVSLNQTAFYPEGGGQPADHGTINNIPVIDVQEIEGTIWHTVEQPLKPGEIVVGKLDWERRFNLMQNHSGEHLISGIISQNYGFHNVGFHMGTESVTVDFDGMLTEEQLWEIEEKANGIIVDDLPIEAVFPSDAEQKQMDYRSKKEIEGQVRLVSIPGVDCCACCGTHVASTGQIRLIKILSVQKYKSGVRVSMLSGEAAFADYQLKHGNAMFLSRLLSLKPDEIGDGVVRLRDKNIALKKELKLLKKQISQLEGHR